LIISFVLIIASCSSPKVERNPANKSKEEKAVVERIEEAHLFFRDRWLETHNDKTLKELLEMVISDNGVMPPESFLTLKEYRKKANLFRISFTIFSRKGSPPKDFDGYVKVFGQLNDSLQFQRGEEAVEFAKWLLEWVKNNPSEEVGKNFKPISFKKFQQNMKALIKELKKAFKKEEMSQHAMHKLRKKLKLILEIYYYDSLQNGTMSESGERLNQLVTEIGLERDEFVRKAFKGIDTPEDNIVRISSKERDNVLRLLKQINNDFKGTDCKSILKTLLLN
jgi:hypothetical protein